MPRIDIPIKRLFQRRPADWVKYVQPECREDWIRQYKTEYTPKKESRLLGNFRKDLIGPSKNYRKGSVPRRVKDLTN